MKKIIFLLFLLIMMPLNVFANQVTQCKEIPQKKLFEIQEVDGYNTFTNMVITTKYIVVLAEKKESVAVRDAFYKDQALLVYDLENFKLAMDPIKVGTNITDMAYDISNNSIYLVNDTTTVQIYNGDTLEKKEDYTASEKIKGISLNATYGYILQIENKIKIISGEESETFDLALPSPIISSNSYAIFTPNGLNEVFFTDLSSSSRYCVSEVNGTLRVMELDIGNNPYFLYQTSSNTGAVYVYEYNPISIEEEIPIISDTLDVKNMTFKATVKDAEGKEYEISSENGLFNLKDLTFNAPGDYTFYVTQIKEDQDILYDEKDISFTIKVGYSTQVTESLNAPAENPLFFETNGFLDIRSIEFQDNKDYFKNEKLDRSMLSCKEIDGKYYNKEGYEVTKEEYLTSCGLVENPQTGASLPIIIMTIGIGIVGIIFYFSKNKIFKI